MRRVVLYLMMLPMIFYIGCRKDSGPCFTSAGEIVSESRPVGSIRIIEVHDNIDLILTHDSTGSSLRVEAGENLISSIKTEVHNEKLVITNENQCNWLRDFELPFRVYVSLNKLDSLEYRSSGDVTCTNVFPNDSIQVDLWEGAGTVKLKVNTPKSFFYIHEGTADLYVSGYSRVTFLSSLASGKADLTRLQSQYLYMYSGSPNHCYVSADQLLGVTIDNIGNVYYLGDPFIEATLNSSGKLIRLE